MTTSEEIRLGDAVRLPNGATITVESKYDWYEDATGRHDGPFVGARGTSQHYLVADVVEVVLRNERLCVFCGEGVTATTSETDFCRNCFYTGRSWERKLAPLLARIDEIDEVVSTAVWHTGGGCFNLAVTLADGRLLTPSEGFRSDDDGTVWPEPGFPDADDPESRWSMVVSASEEAWSEWDESKVWIPQDLYDDDGLVAAIREVAAKSDDLLARRLREAESAGDADETLLATNDLCWRLAIPPDQTEQGLTAEASEKIDAFVAATLDAKEAS